MESVGGNSIESDSSPNEVEKIISILEGTGSWGANCDNSLYIEKSREREREGGRGADSQSIPRGRAAT